MIKKWHLTIFVFLTVKLATLGQERYDQSKTFSKAELESDLHYLQEFLVKGHPGLYWYSSEKDFSDAYRTIENTLEDGMNEIVFLNHLASLNGVIKCAHTDIRPSLAFDNYWKDSVLLIPFNLKKVGADYIINQNLSQSEKLAFGTKIISINNSPIEEVIAQLLPYIPSDGNNLTRKYHALENGFYRYYSYYVDGMSDTYTVAYANQKGDTMSVTVDGIKKEEVDKRKASVAHEDLPPISFQLLKESSTGILKLSTFRHDLMEKENIQFESMISDCFKQLAEKKVENLVIDLRNNGGGYSEYAAVLYSYLTNTRFQYCKKQVVTTDAVIEGIRYDIPATFSDFPTGAVKKNEGYIWINHSVLAWREPSEFHFSGNIFFLINGGSASTSSELATLAHRNGVGYFIGEEVGGCYTGNSGGVLGWFELPNTKIRVRIAMVKFEMTENQPPYTHGVLPNEPISYSIEDIINGRDLEMERILVLINNQPK